MRITKTFEIEGYDESFTVNELRIKEILSLMSSESLEDISLEGMKSKFSDVFLPMCTNIKMEQIEEMTPSEVLVIWEKFREVNKSFFDMAQKMGLNSVIEKLKSAVIEDFGKLAVISSKQGM